MSSFWSTWVIVLLVLNLGLALFLFVWAQIVHIPTEPDGTTGHVWAHGVLRESVRKLPLWWVIYSAIGLLAGIGYFFLYPGFGGFQGALGWTSAQELQRDVAARERRLEASLAPLRGLSLAQLAASPVAKSMGQRLWLDNCAACHGERALGNTVIGAPDLTDADSLYGSDPDTVMASIRDGRTGAMPAWGSALGAQGVKDVAAYVLAFSGIKTPQDWSAAGKARYEAMCVSCHGDDGRGNPALGAPNLTDRTWLYGGDFAHVSESIREGRTGVMPAWRQRLNEDELRLTAAWVLAQRTHSRAP
jgi:cytochrome c oxidase cbb3-type subunit III